jgi:hypothetical protein
MRSKLAVARRGYPFIPGIRGRRLYVEFSLSRYCSNAQMLLCSVLCVCILRSFFYLGYDGGGGKGTMRVEKRVQRVGLTRLESRIDWGILAGKILFVYGGKFDC